ncbi:hypothetical protein EZJ55_20530 [Microcystis aeruginosa EAWAG127a]|uniref:Uncharacterized protein n=1 Tax=Microcystis aeruginosa EAWAG127a TaxID=2529855 RepID=A0A5J5LYK8_MICAE|nr:hypothetical protein [Microcystis aeruginosa]KAB0242580.1 hypothetical protein EZJ55_20530 [Microcystis aeruginosa EAWAG127a]
MKPLNFQNLLIASLLGFSTLFANSYPLVKAQSVKNVSFEVCFNSDTFVRPSPREYIKDKYVNYRGYRNISDVINSPNWKANILRYDSYYGVSGLTDIEIYSGVYYARVRDKNFATGLDKCSSKFAETNSSSAQTQVRLFSYKLKQIKWANNKYIFVVESRNSGLQILHYRKTRQDLASGKTTPIEVIDTKGRLLGRCEYDCQLKK